MEIEEGHFKGIKEFLLQHKTERNEGELISHVGMGEFKGSYCFNPSDSDGKWWNLFLLAIKNDQKISIAERIDRNKTPLLVDVDLEYKYNRSSSSSNDGQLRRMYKESHIKAIVTIYQTVIELVAESEPKHFVCCVLEKEKPYIKTKGQSEDDKQLTVHDGFHLHFPFFVTKKELYDDVIRPKVINSLKSMEVFCDLSIDLIESDFEKIIDPNVPGNPWLMYGCSKPDGEPYKLSHIYGKNCIEHDVTTGLLQHEPHWNSHQSYDGPDISNEGKSQPENTLRDQIYDTPQLKNKGSISDILPKLLSVRNQRPCVKLKQGFSNLEYRNVSKQTKPIRDKSEEEIQQDIIMAKKLLKILAKERLNTTHLWRAVARAIFNVSRGNSDGFDVLLGWSKTSIHWKQESPVWIGQQWDKMKVRGEGMGTLIMFAKKDKPGKYQKIEDKKFTKVIIKACCGVDFDIARVLFKLVGDNFKYIPCEKKGSWYIFSESEHRWKIDKEGIRLRKVIATVLREKFDVALRHYRGKLAVLPSSKDEMKVFYESMITTVKKIQANLGNTPKQGRVLAQAKLHFFDEEFRDKLDSNPMLLGMANGVYDLENHILRPGRPDDFISLSTRIEYEDLTLEDPNVKDVLKFFSEVQTDDVCREHLFMTLGTLVEGGNFLKKFYIWVGPGGDNGKSTAVKLLSAAMGDYVLTFKTAVFFGSKTGGGQADPEFTRAEGKRIAFLNEPSKNDRINDDILKHSTGGDNMSVRDLYQSGKEMRELTPLFKLLMICNMLPKFPPDKAFWNRPEPIEWNSTFSDTAELLSAEERKKRKIFKKDVNFDRKIKRLAPAMLWLMIEYHKKFKTDGIKTPTKLLKLKQEYRKASDFFTQFISERITEDEDGFVDVPKLYVAFKRWFEEGYPRRPVPSRSEVRLEFIRKWGRTVKCGWKGFRIVDVRILPDIIDE